MTLKDVILKYKEEIVSERYLRESQTNEINKFKHAVRIVAISDVVKDLEKIECRDFEITKNE